MEILQGPMFILNPIGRSSAIHGTSSDRCDGMTWLVTNSGRRYASDARYVSPPLLSPILRIQRLIMRILFVCPVYALGSMLSLRFPGASMALETGRDIMEAFVIYSFLCLVLEYAGGESQGPSFRSDASHVFQCLVMAR